MGVSLVRCILERWQKKQIKRKKALRSQPPVGAGEYGLRARGRLVGVWRSEPFSITIRERSTGPIGPPTSGTRTPAALWQWGPRGLGKQYLAPGRLRGCIRGSWNGGPSWGWRYLQQLESWIFMTRAEHARAHGFGGARSESSSRRLLWSTQRISVLNI